MGYTNKSNKMYAAAAALAVTASAVAPIAANAATPAVASIVAPKHIVHYGGFQTAVKKLSFPSTVKVKLSNGKYATRSVSWEKPSFQAQYMNKYQVLEGKVEGTSKKAYLKLLVKDYIIDVAGTVQVEEGKSVTSVMATVTAKSGKKYQREVAVSGINSSEVGHKGSASFEYTAGKNQILTGSFEYAVVENKKAAEYKRWVAVVEEKTAAYEAAATKVAATPSAELLKAAQEAEFKLGGLNAKDKADFQARLDKAAAEVVKAEEALATPKVESVTALNATQVLVKFNKELDKTTAEAEANYKYNNGLLSVADSSATAVLQDDNKSVIVTFSTSKNKTSFAFGVDGVKAADMKVVDTFSTSVSVDDVENPTVKSVAVAANGNLEITFAEPLDAIQPIVRVAGQPVVVETVSAGATKVTVLAANYSLSAGSTASVYVAGAKDTVGNEMSIFNGSVTKVADSTKPTISSIKQIGQNTLRVVFSETLGASSADLVDGELKFLKGAALNSTSSVVTKNTVVDPSGKTYDVAFTASEVYGAPATDSATVTLLLAKDAVADLAGNTIDQYSQSFTFNADKTAPAFVSAAVASDKQTIEVKFDEAIEALDLDIDETKIVITDASGVRYPAIAATTVAKGSGENAKVLLVDFVTGAGLIPNGTYTVQLQAGAVKDALGNLSSAAATTVVIGDAADKTKPAATLDITTTPASGADAPVSAVNKFVVDFSEEVTTSALNLSNYKLDGAALPAGTVIYFNSVDKNSVTIELPTSSVNIGSALTGTNALLNVSGVQDKAGNASDSTNLTVKIGDNTPAVLTSAQKLGNTLVLTFNEALSTTTAPDANISDVLANYEIKSGSNTVVAGNGVATAELVAGSNNKIQITFSSVGTSLYNATETITIKTKSATGDITDANGVRVKGDVTVTAN